MSDAQARSADGSPQASHVRVGTIGAPWGVKGANKITSDTQPPRQIFKYRPWLVERGGEFTPLDFREVRTSGVTLAAIIEDAATPEAAARLTGQGIFIARSLLPPVDDGYYYIDLEGCSVRNLNGVLFGQVTRVFNNGANDVLEVQGERTRLLPFVLEHYVKRVDIAGKEILIDWDEDF